MDGIHSGRFTGSRRPSLVGLFLNNNDCRALSQTSVKKQAVKRHHHKHNLKHRYEFLETLGKGTYGKVKKARERSGRLVSRAPLTVDLLLGLWPQCLVGHLYCSLHSGNLFHIYLLI